MLSINSPNAPGIINNSSLRMEKSDLYKLPPNVKGICLFFKLDSKDHMYRRKIYGKAFSISAYGSVCTCEMLIYLTAYSIKDFYPALSRRTEQLINLISMKMKRDGVINLIELVEHWSYDLMVRFTLVVCASLIHSRAT